MHDSVLCSDVYCSDEIQGCVSKMKGLNFNGIGGRCGPISMRSLVHHARFVFPLLLKCLLNGRRDRVLTVFVTFSPICFPPFAQMFVKRKEGSGSYDFPLHIHFLTWAQMFAMFLYPLTVPNLLLYSYMCILIVFSPYRTLCVLRHGIVLCLLVSVILNGLYQYGSGPSPFLPEVPDF